MTKIFALVAATLFGIACSLPALDETGKACPCSDGFACDAAAQKCVLAAGLGGAASMSSATTTTTTASTTSSGGGASTCSDKCGTPGCGTCPTTPMIAVQAADGSMYSVAATEVTVADYQTFLATNPDRFALMAVDQKDKCTWNTSLAPGVSNDATVAECAPYDPTIHGAFPVGCVDWCDAVEYCLWSGARLCGAIGGGPVDYGSVFDPTKSEWMNACTHQGEFLFPYGGTTAADYVPGKCQDGGTVVDVGTKTQCTGGFSGLLDMSGNVEEWEASCDFKGGDGSDDDCPLRGGPYWGSDMSGLLECDSGVADMTAGLRAPHRTFMDPGSGIRCCAD